MVPVVTLFGHALPQDRECGTPFQAYTLNQRELSSRAPRCGRQCPSPPRGAVPCNRWFWGFGFPRLECKCKRSYATRSRKEAPYHRPNYKPCAPVFGTCIVQHRLESLHALLQIRIVIPALRAGQRVLSTCPSQQDKSTVRMPHRTFGGHTSTQTCPHICMRTHTHTHTRTHACCDVHAICKRQQPARDHRRPAGVISDRSIGRKSGELLRALVRASEELRKERSAERGKGILPCRASPERRRNVSAKSRMGIGAEESLMGKSSDQRRINFELSVVAIVACDSDSVVCVSVAASSEEQSPSRSRFRPRHRSQSRPQFRPR